MPTVARYDFEEPVVWAGFVDDEPIFALADGAVVFPTGQVQTFKAHDGLLAATATQKGDGLISGGEDGRIVVTNRTGVVERTVHPGKWIDAVAAGPGAAIGYAAARSAWILTPSVAAPLEFAHERAVEGVCFAPKGLRIACARYNGVTLHWGIGTGKPVDLSWDGAHTGVTFSPDGSYVVTTMTENALHGWKLDRQNSGNSKHMRMSGYPTKPKCLSWSPRGRWLASSGASSAVLWPFVGKDGPMGKTPKQLANREGYLVTQVACHPVSDVVAVGYNDGLVGAANIHDDTDMVLRRPGEGLVPSAISSLSWDKNGNRLAFGTEEGEAGVISVP